MCGQTNMGLTFDELGRHQPGQPLGLDGDGRLAPHHVVRAGPLADGVVDQAPVDGGPDGGQHSPEVLSRWQGGYII